MKCLLTCVSSFPAMPKKISDSIIERLVCAVTHTPMPSVEKNQINLDLVRFDQIESCFCLDYFMKQYTMYNVE